MITTGFPWSSATKTEIIDIASGVTCSDLEDFPVEIFGGVATGGWQSPRNSNCMWWHRIFYILTKMLQIYNNWGGGKNLLP